MRPSQARKLNSHVLFDLKSSSDAVPCGITVDSIVGIRRANKRDVSILHSVDPSLIPRIDPGLRRGRRDSPLPEAAPENKLAAMIPGTNIFVRMTLLPITCLQSCSLST